MAATVINISLGPDWRQHVLPTPFSGPCKARCSFGTRCYDQRISVADLCASAECCACSFCRSGPSSTWSTPSGVVLESLTTATVPPFVFVYNPLDQDMLYARHRLLVEPELTMIWSNSTRSCCAAHGGTVVDVGANFGWYTMLSLALGCSVVAFEPVANYQDVLRLAVHLNGDAFARRLTVFGNAVLDKPGHFKMVVPLAGVARANPPQQPQQPSAGEASAAGAAVGEPSLSSHMRTHMGMAALLGPRGRAAVKNVAKLSPGTLTYQQPVDAVRLDGIVAQPLCMLKIDIEGLEPQALASAQRLLAYYPIRVVQLEVNRNERAQGCAIVRMLRTLLLHGFALHKVTHTRACWEGACVHDYRSFERDVRSLISTELMPRWDPRRPITVRTLARDSAAAAAEAAAVYARVTDYSWNLIAYQRSRRPPGWPVPDLPLERAQAARCRMGPKQCKRTGQC